MKKLNLTKFNRLRKYLEMAVVLISTIVMIAAIAFIVEETKKNELKKELIVLNIELAQQESTTKTFYSVVLSESQEAQKALEQVKRECQKALESVVCSEVNRHNTKAQKAYDAYKEIEEKRKEKMAKYVKEYESCQKILKRIIEIERKLGFEHLTDLSVYSPNAIVDVIELEKEVIKLLSESNAKTESLYNEYYELMVRITNAEAGADYYSDFDQFCVMNVIENRVKSIKYPNTVKKVIFQKGQYAPTWDGTWNKAASKRTQRNVKEYLLGQVDTGMPENVIYQAMFPQGDYIWKHIENPVDVGHYYCGEQS